MASEQGWTIHSVYYAGDVELSTFAREALEASGARKLFEVTSPLFDALRWSRKNEKRSEFIALIEMPPEDLAHIPVDGDSLVVVFDRPSDHGNLGSVIRACEAFEASGLIITGRAVDNYDPQTVRASMGSLFRLPVVRAPSHREVRVWADALRGRHPQFRVVGSSAHAGADARLHDFRRPLALVIGNETRGISANFVKACDDIVGIPMGGSVTSLNVAAAAAILLYEASRR